MTKVHTLVDWTVFQQVAWMAVHLVHQWELLLAEWLVIYWVARLVNLLEM